MAFVIDKVSEDTFYENILIGLTKILDGNPRIKNVYLERQQACLPSDISLWEQLHSVKLPDDLKDFYLATNGFKLTWSYAFSEQEILQVGAILVNNLSDLSALTGYKTYSPAEIKSRQTRKYRLSLGSDSKVFQLSKVDETARVCLVYPTPRSTPSIWLMDPDLKWHYLCKNFTKYFCMNVAHLGLPLWQYCFTPYGIPSWVEQMFIMTTPHLPVSQVLDREYEENLGKLVYVKNCYINKLDTSMFKPKTRVNNKSTDIFKYRKKP